MKSFLDYWPLHNYLFLNEINKTGTKTYYDILVDEFIQEEEALKREKDDYRNSSTYWISGPRKLINEVYKDLSDKYLPEIPSQTLKNMEEKRKQNPILKKFNVCQVVTRKEAEKKAHNFEKLPRDIENQSIKHTKVTNWSNKVWKPRIGNYVTIEYRKNYESIVYKVTSITKNQQNQVIQAHLIPYSVKYQRNSLVNEPIDIKLYTSEDPTSWLSDRWISSRNKTKVDDNMYPGKQIEKHPQEYQEDELQKIYSILGQSGLDLYYRYKELSDQQYENKILNIEQEKESLAIYSQLRAYLY